MSWKTLIEDFSKAEEALTTSPFEALDNGVTIIAVPDSGAGPAVEEPKSAEKPAGTTLNMPAIPNTKTIEVHSAPDLFKGDLPHLPKEEHEAIIAWFDKESVNPNTPAEVRKYLLDTVMRLKSDAIKRIPDEEPVMQEGLFRSALEKVGLASKPEPIAELPANIPDVRVNPTYKIEVQIDYKGQWKTGLSFTQDEPISRNGIAKLWAKTHHGTQHLDPKPTKMRILQNGNQIHEDTI